MREQHFREDREYLKELLRQFENLREGRSHSFIDEESFEKIIDYFDEKEEFSRALEAANFGIDQYPYSSSLLIRKADLLLASRRYKAALEVLDQASVFDGSDINLYILKTDALLALDQQEQAVELLQQALTLFDGEERIELLFELADVYDDYEEFDKVFDCLKMILEEDQNNEEALYKICFWTEFTGRNEESIRLHQDIIDEYPYNELAWFNLGAGLQGLKLYEKSIDAYKYAVTIDEKFDYAYRNMGDAYIRLRKYKDAIEMLEKVLELSKPEDVIYEAIAHCFEKMKNYAQARFHYRKAVHLNPEESKLFYKIACTYYNEGQFDAAIKQLVNATRIHRNQTEYLLLMGECRLKLEAYKDAIQNFSDVVRIKPRSMKGWEALIRCLYKAGYYEEAIEQVNVAFEISNGKPILQFYNSAILFALGKNKTAIIQLEKAMDKAPRLLKKFVELNPSILQNQLVVDLIARFKRNKSI
jgi:tetratricopeptide (TPR) repeat protein